MGQKVHPHGMRIGIIHKWNSYWYSDKKDFSRNIYDDFRIRQYLIKKLSSALISCIIIEKYFDNIKIFIHTARPGIIIGKKGEDIDKLCISIYKIIKIKVKINIITVNKPELDAKLIARNIASQLEHRVMFRRLAKRAIQNAINFGAKGIKVQVGGRLNGAEIARTESYREGRVPLHTLRANIDYGNYEAFTTYGVIGVKVWIFKGEEINNNLIEISKNVK